MNHLINSAVLFVKTHSPVILSGVASVGVLATAYFTGKASFEAAKQINTEPYDTEPYGPEEFKDKVKLVWRRYIPPAITCVVTIGCIAGSSRIAGRRIMAGTIAYSVADQVFQEYKAKVVEQLGPRKEQVIRDEIAQDRIDKNKPPEKMIMSAGPGHIMCYELLTGRYFISDMETLRKAQNDVNAKIIKHDHASLDDFYHLVGLKQTSISGEVGWFSSRLMELTFSTTLSEQGIPCITFDYNYTRLLHDNGNFHGICMAE